MQDIQNYIPQFELGSSATARQSEHAAVVHGIVQDSTDTRSLLLTLPTRGFHYQAGQYLTLDVPCAEGAVRRSYSFSSSPEVDSVATVTVKRVPGGVASNWLHDHVGIGTVLRVRPPSGQFTLDPRACGTLLLLGAGSGITPLISLLKSALSRTARRVRLFYANRSHTATVFRRQLDLLVANHPSRLEVHYHYDEEHGTPTNVSMAEQLRAFDRGDVYLCGPSPFMQLAEEAVAQHAPEAQLHAERFAARAPVGGLLTPEAVTGTRVSQVSWALDGSSTSFPVRPELTVLQAARLAGLDPIASCEEGYCGSCAVKLLRGKVRMASTDGLSRSRLEQGFILPCQAYPLTDELELR